MYVQLTPDDETVISYFAGPQDPEVWPNVVEIEASDSRWHTYYYGLPPLARIGMPEPVAP